MAIGRPADRDGRRSEAGFDNGAEKGSNGFAKFYVARLPERCSSKDISKSLEPYGKVEGVYVARKRDKNGFRFGFASFSGVKDVEELEKKMKNVWMGSYRLFINIARFTADNDDVRGNRDSKGKKKIQGHRTQEVRYQAYKDQGGSSSRPFAPSGKSYADVLSGNQQEVGIMKEVVASVFAKAFEELHGKAIIGRKRRIYGRFGKMNVLLKEEKYGDTTIKYLGGLSILLVFKSSFEADIFRADIPGFGWFDSVESWTGQMIAFERLAWLNIYGVPLHLSGNETFDSVGRCFGKVIHASQRQPEDNILT
ncbi:uncharacterized protein LOC110899536 [Helianthus annuus]|uniref:uncharacterized protein LOC110899536 n=1 Tax=Helianthus annuus TaxID=4232 RepID=UPI000B8F13B2|nr:uncharacterized protein LOC110899536 [Helianthus annuus]